MRAYAERISDRSGGDFASRALERTGPSRVEEADSGSSRKFRNTKNCASRKSVMQDFEKRAVESGITERVWPSVAAASVMASPLIISGNWAESWGLI